jgi:hypothetical protein
MHRNEVRWISNTDPDATEPVTVTVSAKGSRVIASSSNPAVPPKRGTLESKDRFDDDARRLALLLVLLPDHLAFAEPKGVE